MNKQGSVMDSTLYLLYIAHLPTTRLTTVATFVDDTSVLVLHAHSTLALRNILTNQQDSVLAKKNGESCPMESMKPLHLTFTLGRETYPSLKLINKGLSLARRAKCFDMHLDWRRMAETHLDQAQTYWT